MKPFWILPLISVTGANQPVQTDVKTCMHSCIKILISAMEWKQVGHTWQAISAPNESDTHLAQQCHYGEKTFSKQDSNRSSTDRYAYPMLSIKQKSSAKLMWKEYIIVLFMVLIIWANSKEWMSVNYIASHSRLTFAYPHLKKKKKEKKKLLPVLF